MSASGDSSAWRIGLAVVAAALLAALGSGAGGIPGPENPPGFALIPAGRFEMGDHHGFVDPKHGSDETPLHTVRLDAFYMGVNDVTTGEYGAFLNSALAQKGIEVRQGGVYLSGGLDLLFETRAMSAYSRIGWDGRQFLVLDGKERHPVVCVRWAGAAAYANWLSAQLGQPLCYDTTSWACDFNQSGFRLPTEAEWEYAARGGLQNPYRNFPWGDEPDATKANWPESKNPFRQGLLPWTTPAGFFDGRLHRKAEEAWPAEEETFQTSNGANGYGLYDMAGNVWQLVNDWYGRDYYANSPAENPPGPDQGSPMPDGRPYRGLRGGSWFNGEWGHSRVSNRNPSYYRGPEDPSHPYYHIGFRLVLPIDAERRTTVKPTPAQEIKRAGGTASGRPRQQLNPPPRPEDRRPPRGGAGRADNSRGGQPPSGGGRGGRPVQEVNKTPVSPNPGQTVGLFLGTAAAWNGYTLLAPKHNMVTYLIDNQGRAVHSWKSEYEPGQSAYVLPNGHLIRAGLVKALGGTGGGEGGRLEEYDWDGRLVWEFDHATRESQLHHDFKVMPNGHILALMVELKSAEAARAAGFEQSQLRDSFLMPDAVVEIEPVRPKGGRIVWKWSVWDHLIQNQDRKKDNYGDPAAHPERIDVACNGRPTPAFWNHMNSIDYNPDLDQIALSVRGCNEIWILDHSTTIREAAGRSGGQHGKGGDLIYRWGNPAAYGRGRARDRQLFEQHDAQWIPAGSPGAGHILIFNNGLDRGWSSVEEIVPPVGPDGRYLLEAGRAYGPDKSVWHYEAQNRADFYSSEISGAQRLPNGNTLVCAGVAGHLFEVTPDGAVVWQYVNPVVRGGILAQGELPDPDHRGHLYNAVFRVQRYGPDFPGLLDRDLTPRGVIELPAPQKGKGGNEALAARSEERVDKGEQGGLR